MWKAGAKKDDKGKSPSSEEDVKRKKRQKDKRMHSTPSDKEESSREEDNKESNDGEISGNEKCAVSGSAEVSLKESEEKEEEEKTKQNEVQTTGERGDCVDILEESTQSRASVINSGSGGLIDAAAATLMVQANR